MADLLTNFVYVPIVVLLLFGAAIFVHEWGHYIVARRRGLKVEAFAIGFGPPIYAWKRDGIEYSIRWIPAGGFVKLPQMITSEALEGGQEENAEPLPPVSPWSKILVAFAGPFMNVVFAFAIAAFLYVVGLPVKVNPSIVGDVPKESEAYAQGVRPGDQVVGINGKEVSTWDQVFQTVMLARTSDFQVEVLQAGARKTVNLKAEVHPDIGLKLLPLRPKDPPYVEKIMNADGPAAKAGLRDKDQILSFAGQPIASGQQLIAEINRRGGEECEIVINRGGQVLTLKITPQGSPKALIGIQIGSAAEHYVVQRPGPLPWVLVGEVWDQIRMTIYALVHSKETGVGVGDLSGPPGILAVLASQVKADLRLALKFMILLNISLAVMNLLPIPVLDGGHIAMAILERFRGKPLSLRLQEYTTTAFALLLISFMLYVSFNDIMRWSMFKSMFNQDVRIESVEKNRTPPPVPAPASTE